MQLSNEGTGKAQLLTEHEFYAAFLEAFQACQESEKLLHTAKSESLNVANKVGMKAKAFAWNKLKVSAFTEGASLTCK